MKRLLFALTALLAFGALAVVAPVAAQVTAVPNSMNFQGRLSRPDGTPVTDGTYVVCFRLYDALTGGNIKFEQTLSNVALRKGTFAVTLSGFAAGTFQSNLWLGTKIGADAELAPRQPLVTVPFAFKADSVKDGSITGASIADGTITDADFAPSALGWLLNGNSGVTSGFLGTTDSQPLAFHTNNTEKMRLLANGNVGIGTNNPQALLDVRGNVNIGTANLPLGLTHELGGDTPILNLDVNFRQPNKNDAFRGGAIRIDTRGNEPLFQFLTRASGSATENIPVVISGNGQVGIGTRFPSYSLHVEGDVRVRATTLYGLRAETSQTNGIAVKGESNSGPNAVGLWGVSSSGFGVFSNGVAGGTSGWQTFSDTRYKHNVATLENSLDTILNLRGVTFDWKREDFPSMNFTGRRQIGFIAQEVESVLPQIVHTDGKGYKSVIYANVVPVLVEAVKVQQRQMERLKEENDSKSERLKKVEAQNAELRARLDAVLKRIERLESGRK